MITTQKHMTLETKRKSYKTVSARLGNDNAKSHVKLTVNMRE